ncbi:chromosome partitioning protein ParB [Beijerinckiaceae bacterium]|nr:chromosome partitioning protein ParB [Beijerinckiaceae bacterium]
MTLGYDEVAFKRRIWRAQTSDERSRFICEHPFPAVVGPKGEYYILDGHHLGRALFDEGVDKVRLSLIDDFSHLDPGMFWQVMERRNLIYPYDQGRRRDFEDMPKSLRDLLDDPFRSLAAQVRRFCQYGKDPTPFVEFQWADYLRNHISFSTLRAYPERAFKYARRLLQKRATNLGGKVGANSMPPAQSGRPRCYHSLRSCDECDARALQTMSSA